MKLIFRFDSLSQTGHHDTGKLGVPDGWGDPVKTCFILAALLMSTAAFAEERAINEKVIVKAGLDDVWQAWTTREGIKSFFAPDANIELRVDGPFEIFINPLAEPGMKGADGMRILAIQDKAMLSFTWNAPPHLPEARKQRTYVTLRFQSQGDSQTLVTLFHGGWGEGGEWDKAYAYFKGAWPSVLRNLQKRFDTGPVDWTEWLKRLKELQLPARTIPVK